MSRVHSLLSQEQDMSIKWFEKFDKFEIKQTILKHLADNPTDTLEHCKEYSKKDIKIFYGSEIINFYEVNPKNGKPSLVYQRSSKQYYKQLT
jgi:hypothetical protein